MDVIQGLSSVNENNILNFNSSVGPIPKRHTYKKRASWSKDYIKSNKFKPSNFTQKAAFKSLAIKEQQAIRYQMKKKAAYNGAKGAKKMAAPKKKNRVVTKAEAVGAAITMAFVAIIEGLVLVRSAPFFILMGFSPTESVLAAVCLEFGYMATSISREKSLQVLRYALLVMSIMATSYAAYKNDGGLTIGERNRSANYSRIKQEIDLIDADISGLNLEKISQNKSMEIYQNHNLITKGLLKLGPEKKMTRHNISSAQEKRAGLVQKLNQVEAVNADYSVFSINSLKSIHITTWFGIFFMILLQIMSSIGLRRAYPILTQFVKTENKPKNTRKKYYQTLKDVSFMQ